jgi:predicted ribosomally synthesized peptide with SipW-like signal peptide
MRTFFKQHPALDKITDSSCRICLVLLAMASVYSLNLVLPTNSFFSDSETVGGNSFTAGYWIPVLTYGVPPVNGTNGWYKASRPCITLTAKIGDTTDGSIINYTFETPGGTVVDSGSVLSGTCVPIPDGELNFSAVAVNDENSDWKSDPLNKTFKVDTVAPDVPQWDGPADKIFTRQDENIKIQWHSSDATSGVAGYKYISDYPGGEWDSYNYCHGLLTADHIPSAQVGPGGSCINDHEATLGKDGNYKRKVKAVDEAGNESDYSPVWEMNRDTVKPSSEVDTVTQDDSDANPLKLTVSFSASDDNAGVKQVEIFYQKDGDGSWSSAGKFDKDESPVTIYVDSTGEYHFYSLAEDQADDLGSSDMASGSGDNGQGNIEDKEPLNEYSIVVEDGGGSGDGGGDGACEGDECGSPASSLKPVLKTDPATVEDTTMINTEDDPKDNAGDKKTSVDKLSGEDQTPPASQIKKIKKRTGKKNNHKFKFTLRARDADSGVAKTVVYYREGDEDWKKLGETNNDIFKSDKLDKGVYEFYTLAEDKVGNQEQKDNPKPEGRITITKDKTTIEILTGDKKAKKTKKSSKKKGKKTKVKKSSSPSDKKKSVNSKNKKKTGKKKK